MDSREDVDNSSSTESRTLTVLLSGPKWTLHSKVHVQLVLCFLPDPFGVCEVCLKLFYSVFMTPYFTSIVNGETRNQREPRVTVNSSAFPPRASQHVHITFSPCLLSLTPPQTVLSIWLFLHSLVYSIVTSPNTNTHTHTQQTVNRSLFDFASWSVRLCSHFLISFTQKFS